MTAESDEFFHRADVEDLDELVSGGGRDEVTCRTPVAGLDGILVSMSERSTGQRRCDGREGGRAYKVVRT